MAKPRLTPALRAALAAQGQVVQLVRMGAPPTTALRALGLRPESAHALRVLAQGRGKTAAQARAWWEAVEAAQAEYELLAIKAETEALKAGDAKVAARVLERRRPLLYDAHTRANVARLGGDPDAVDAGVAPEPTPLPEPDDGEEPLHWLQRRLYAVALRLERQAAACDAGGRPEVSVHLRRQVQEALRAVALAELGTQVGGDPLLATAVAAGSLGAAARLVESAEEAAELDPVAALAEAVEELSPEQRRELVRRLNKG